MGQEGNVHRADRKGSRTVDGPGRWSQRSAWRVASRRDAGTACPVDDPGGEAAPAAPRAARVPRARRGGGGSPVMRDVARAAGVSQQTVSRVLRDHPNVRAETRDRVMAAVRALDYRPNSAARALVTGRTRPLVVVSPDSALYSPAATVFGIESAARQAGYFVSFICLL